MCQATNYINAPITPSTKCICKCEMCIPATYNSVSKKRVMLCPQTNSGRRTTHHNWNERKSGSLLLPAIFHITISSSIPKFSILHNSSKHIPLSDRAYMPGPGGASPRVLTRPPCATLQQKSHLLTHYN